MANNWYDQALVGLLDGTYNFKASTGLGWWKAAVLAGTTGANFNPAHTSMQDILAFEVAAGSGYVGGFAGSGRKILTSRDIVRSGRYACYVADTLIIGACSGFTPTAVAYFWQPVAATLNSQCPLIYWQDQAQVSDPFGRLTDGTNLQFLFDALGVWNFQFP